MKKFIIKTIGCKVNTYESNKIRDELVNLGFFNLSDDENNYDNVEYFIINTCSVTNIADRKSRQMIHRAKKLNPNLKIVATGCYVDSHIDDIDADIDIYVENKKKFDIPKILFDLEKDNTENFNITKKNYV